MRKYVLVPGYVVFHGEEYYVSAHRLAQLYDLEPREYIVKIGQDGEWANGFNIEEMDWLYPRQDNNYQLERKC